MGSRVAPTFRFHPAPWPRLLLGLCLVALTGCRKEAPAPAKEKLGPESLRTLGETLARNLSQAHHDPDLWLVCRSSPALRGDLDGDSTSDAAILVHCDYAGPQSRQPKLLHGYTEVGIWVFPATGGRFVGTLQAGGSDDDIVSLSLHRIHAGKLEMTLLKRGHGDSLCCPSLRVKTAYKVEGRRFVPVY
ncbi:MAG: hypothetical protein RL318_1091 [Fibrobacterota bacterium]